MRDLLPSAHDRLLYTCGHATGSIPARRELLAAVPLEDPNALRAALSSMIGEERTVVVTGTLDRRLVLIQQPSGSWTAADLSGQPHRSRVWPAWTTGYLTVTDPDSWLSTAQVTAEGQRRLLRPRLLLASLYHPEHFPLPRFPLAISDLARAARSTLLGRVELMDMQLGFGLDDIVDRVRDGVDVLGVSVTFGQHDLAVRLLDAVAGLDRPPLVVAGGSLTARNERILLDQYPNLLICRGAGEPTIADVLAHWHGDLHVGQIRGLGFRNATQVRTAFPINLSRRTAAGAVG
jgi:hypothetical protein